MEGRRKENSLEGRCVWRVRFEQVILKCWLASAMF